MNLNEAYMEKLIMIKYGELSTKKDNINLFLHTLKENIAKKLEKNQVKILYDKGRMFLFANENELESIQKKLKEVFGIYEFVIGYKYDTLEIEILKKEIVSLLKDKEWHTFKVETKRSNKKIEGTSTEISSKIGAYILKNTQNKTVDIHAPEMLINVELRQNESFVYLEREKGLGGYPVGVQGKGMLMLSGGIDSPTAGYLAMKRGIKIEALYFESPPHTSLEAKNKVIELAKILAKYNNNEIKLHCINFTEIQESIYKNIPHEYLITIMRRMMYRIAECIATRNNAKVILNGESIGQVASQTLTSMNAINEVIDMPVIRPVACFDKLEIIELAKKIGTYETSILPYEDCCTIFVPKHPVINPNKNLCREYENLIPYEELIYRCIKNHETIKITPDAKKDFSDLL